MTTLDSFNHMLKEFVGELSATFPDYPQIMLFKTGLPAMLADNPRQGLDTFMAATSPHGDKIMQGDVSTLFVLGITIQSLDPKILNGIEDIAKDAAKTMKETGSVDMTTMLPQMMSKVGSLMGMPTPDESDPRFKSIMSMVGDNLSAGGVSDILPALGDPTDYDDDDD